MSGGKVQRADARRNRERILEAAERVVAEKGPAASTGEIARVAGVGIGTVFRHFPAKEDLLRAILEARLQGLLAEAERLVESGDPATAFYTFFADMVERAAEKKSIVDLLAASSAGVAADKPLEALERLVGRLLERAQEAGAVRSGVELPEVMALLEGTCRGAVEAGWDAGLRQRTLDIIFAGLRS